MRSIDSLIVAKTYSFNQNRRNIKIREFKFPYLLSNVKIANEIFK